MDTPFVIGSSLGGCLGYLLIFFLLGRGERRVRGAGRGAGRFFIESRRKGGFSQEEGGGGEGPGGCLRGLGGGGG